jgi:hypothetical protein
MLSFMAARWEPLPSLNCRVSPFSRDYNKKHERYETVVRRIYAMPIL